jgi:hypothetical protein
VLHCQPCNGRVPQIESEFQALGLGSQDLAEDGIDLDLNPHRWPDPRPLKPAQEQQDNQNQKDQA